MKEELIEIIKKGPSFYKKWRAKNPNEELDFSNADLSGLNLYDLNIRDKEQYYILDLSGSNFSNSNLEGAVLRLINLENSDFSNANLINSSFAKSNCCNCKFNGSNLTKSSFARGKISNSNFENSILDYSDFTASEMLNLNLKNASLLNINLPEFNSFQFQDLGLDPFFLLTCQNILSIKKDSLELLKPKFSEILEILSKGYVVEHWKYYDAQNTFIGKSTRKVDFISDLIKDGKYDNFLSKVNFLVNYYSRPSITEISELSININKELIKFLKDNPGEIYNIHWREFEFIIAELLSFYGWKVEITSPSKDGGYDMIGIYKDMAGINHNWLIECKKWSKENMVGVDVVRSLYGVKSDLKFGNALLATTSNFTKGAKDFKLSRYDLELKDYNDIIDWIKQYRKNDY
nr:restriction endonuclease [uncultured Draconibacterium sp.]